MSRNKPSTPRVRCAVYTRKSTEDGLQQEFNSLDAQREAAEAFIASQKAEGWVCLPDRYDDGGFSGGNADRPGLKRLMADIENGQVDCVMVYKVDRLSRSLLDFARIMGTFESHDVSFVSVTQQFNTTHSMGRLTLNILLSFAQFEREIIGERIRDKIAAQRRKGKWTGGVPVLGYDVDRSGPSPKLVVNATEAARVRTIFDLYLKLGSLLPVVDQLDERGWRGQAAYPVGHAVPAGRVPDHHPMGSHARCETPTDSCDPAGNPSAGGRMRPACAGRRAGMAPPGTNGRIRPLGRPSRQGPVDLPVRQGRVRRGGYLLAGGRYWNRWNGLPAESITVTDKQTQALQDELRKYYWPKELRGRHCRVHHYPRSNGVDYFFAYLDDWPDRLLVFDDDGEMAPRSERYAFTNVFAFDHNIGCVDLVARGGRKVHLRLREAFCRSVLGVDVEDGEPVAPAYRLDHLLDSNLALPTDSSDRITSVRLTRVRLVPKHVVNAVRYEEIGFSQHATLHTAATEISERLADQNLSPGHVSVKQAGFQLQFLGDGTRKPKTMTFNVSCPNSCDLKSKPDEMREIGERCLKLWGIVHG